MSKILVAYFSASGVTEKVAEELAKAGGADLFEIKPEIPYTEADLDWKDERSRSTLEMKDPDCRPAIVGKVADMARYGTIFLGFPIWWEREPSVVDTFLEGYDFTGKMIVPFCTSGGSELCGAPKRIAELAPGARIGKGRRLGGTVSEEDLKIWAAGPYL